LNYGFPERKRYHRGKLYLCRMKRSPILESISVDCLKHLRAVNDTRDMLSGKWKVMIIGSLSFGKMRFSELQNLVAGIGPKMLSKELQDLVMNKLVVRTEIDTKPLTVEYGLSAYGQTLKPVIEAMANWGKEYRDNIVRADKLNDLPIK
jgi:DNA-binding HxlR family transcriptional regulator